MTRSPLSVMTVNPVRMTLTLVLPRLPSDATLMIIDLFSVFRSQSYLLAYDKKYLIARLHLSTLIRTMQQIPSRQLTNRTFNVK